MAEEQHPRGEPPAGGQNARHRERRPVLRRLVLLGTGALAVAHALGGIYAPPAWHAGDDFWLVQLLATGAFLLAVLAGSPWRFATASGRVALALGLVLPALMGQGYADHPRAARDTSAEAGLPALLRTAGARSVEIAISPDDAYRIEATVGDTRLRFLVDTGASDIVLQLSDACRLGFNPAKLQFRERLVTVNGAVRAAPVTLREMRIGPIVLHDLPALVTESDLDQSLVGMSLLTRFAELTIRDGVLRIRQ